MRLFVAVDLTEDLRHRLAVTLDAIEIPGRRATPPQWHITLRFLGLTDQVGLERVCAALDQAPLPAVFPVTFSGLGGFPRPANATVVWLGAEGDGLAGLADTVEEAAQQAGFVPEDRPFRPHLTLGRVRPPADIRGIVASFPDTRWKMRVDEIVVFRSHLGGPGGTWYEPLERFSLG